MAVDHSGAVLAATRVPHAILTPRPNVLEHDARVAWHEGVRTAAQQVATAAGRPIAAVNVAAMVPSLCPVGADGLPIGPGLLYGDERAAGATSGLDPSQDGEFERMLAHLVGAYPDAAAFWPAQAVANAALSGVGALDSVAAMTTVPVFDYTNWDPEVCARVGVRPDQLPVIRSGSEPAGRVRDELGPELAGAVVGPGTIDAFGEQLVAGADRPGDVLVILGATLITWACVPEWVEAPGLWTVPHTAPGMVLVGGPSNAGGLLVEWARRTLVAPDGLDGVPGVGSGGDVDPDDVPVVLGYLRGERTPLHDRDRRGEVLGLSVAHGPEAVWRGVYESSGHSVRHHLDLAGLLGPDTAVAAPPGAHRATRIVATGGGTRLRPWIQAIADVTGLPVDVVATAEGGALGAAWLARVSAGLVPDPATTRPWTQPVERTVPDPRWRSGCDRRYRRFIEATGAVPGHGDVG